MSEDLTVRQIEIERMYDEAMADVPVTMTYAEATELERRCADADAQVAALRMSLAQMVDVDNNDHSTCPDDCPVLEADRVLSDTQSAAKAHDEALVKPWREALETLIAAGHSYCHLDVFVVLLVAR